MRGAMKHPMTEFGSATIPSILGVIDTPQAIVFRDDPITITGWVVALAPIRRRSIWIDGRFVGNAEYNIVSRPDVAKHHPEYPNAANSSFRFECPPLGAEAVNRV